MLKKVLIVLAVLLLVVGFLATREWDAPELGQRILDEAGAVTGATITASGFRFNLFRGVILENVEATASQEGREVTASLDRLLLEHRVWPLLSGTVAVDQVLLERPRIEIVEWGEPEAEMGEAPEEKPAEPTEPAEPAETAGSEGGGLALDVRLVRVEDGELVMRRRDEEGETRVQGLDFEMRNFAHAPGPRSFASLTAEGDLRIETVGLYHFELRDLASRFQLAGARFEMPELSLTTDYGDLEADAEVDFNPTPYTYRLSARGPSIDVNRAVGASSGFGPASLELDVDGAGADPEAVHAAGVAALSAGEFPAVAVFEKIDEVLGKQVLAGNGYEATEARFEMRDGVVQLAPLRFEAERLRMDVQGTASLEGPIDFDVSLATLREGVQIQGVGANVLDVLADDEGWVPIPVHVSGTLEEPRVTPDSRALIAQAGSGLKREATDKAEEALRGLIPKIP